MLTCDKTKEHDRLYHGGEAVRHLFGLAMEKDEALLRALQEEAGKARRAALIAICNERFIAARREWDEETRVGADDADRVRTRLHHEMEAAKNQGGAAIWAIMRAIGHARRDLAGKRTQPRGDKPGMTVIRPADGGEIQRSKAGVLRALQTESAALHQEGGSSPEATLEIMDILEAGGIPMVAPEATLDTRTEVERWLEERTKRKDEEEVQQLRRRWEEIRATAMETEGEEEENDGHELTDAEYMELTTGLRRHAGHLLSDETLAKGWQCFREVQGVGLGGFSGIWLAKGSASSRRRYENALRGVVADLLLAGMELEAASDIQARRRAQARIRQAAPRGWTRWLVILLSKPRKPLDQLSKRRDIYLQPHGLKLLMNGFKTEYDELLRVAQPLCNSGFRRARDAPEAQLSMAHAREEAYSTRSKLMIAWTDKPGYFMSMCRKIQRTTELRMGTRVSTTSTILALQASIEVAIDSGEGLTHGVDSETGAGQGDSAAAARSMIPLAVEERAVEYLVLGTRFDGPHGVARNRVVQSWFADDGCLLCDCERMMVVGLSVQFTMARMLGTDIGVEEGLQPGDTVSKTGWGGIECVDGTWREIEDDLVIKLPDGRKVPRVPGWYKHVGFIYELLHGWRMQRQRALTQCRAVIAAITRLGVLGAEHCIEIMDTATISVISYHGSACPLGRRTCDMIDVAKRRGMAILGHRGMRTSRWLMHAPKPWGMGMAITFAHAAAALVVQHDRAYKGPPGSPARAAVAARTGTEYWRLTWRPTNKEPVPMAWNPWHLLGSGALTEERLIEATLLYRLMAGVATVAAAGDGARDALSEGYTIAEERDEGDAALWGQAGRTHSWRLGQLGLVRLEQLYGGVELMAGDGGELVERGRVHTRNEAGGMFGRGGMITGGRRTGARLSRAEGREYDLLIEELSARELQWIHAQRGPARTRPAEPVVTAVLSSRELDRGGREYLIRWDGKTEEWGPRPVHATTAIRRQLNEVRDRCNETEERAGGWQLRDQLLKKRGPTWVWMAMEGPRAVGKRDTVAIRRNAEKAGVDTARKQVARLGTDKALEVGRRRLRMATEAETAGRKAERAAHETSQRQEAGTTDVENWRRAAEHHHRTAAEAEVATTLERALDAAAAEERIKGRQLEDAPLSVHVAIWRAGTDDGPQTTECNILRAAARRAATAEAEHVAALTRRAIAELMRYVVTWAQSQPTWTNGHARNADGAGSAEERFHNVTPTRFHTSGRPVDFIGSLVAPTEEGGKGHMETSLRLEPAAAARAAQLPRGLRPPDTATPGMDECVAWRKEQMWWPNASATNGTNSGPEPGRTNASTSTSRVPERTRQHIERRRMRALELRVEAAERTRREGELQRRGERETGRKQGTPATDEAQTAPDGTDTHARDTVAFGAEEYQDWRKQNTRGAANTENQTEQAITTTMAEEGREQEPTDAQRADEEAELAGAMEEEARREAAWDEQQRTTQMLRLDMEEAEAVEMAQEAADMLQQAQEQEEMEQAAAMNERVAEQQSATTKERKAIAEADEEAKEQLQRLGTQQRDAREKAQRKAADAKYSDVQYWEDMSPQLRKAITRSAALRIGVRHRALEQAIPTILAVGGAPVGMEPDERAKIKVGPTKEVVRMARALEKAYGRFHSVIAVDASADKHEARHDGESGTTASAWGAWDGVRMLGGGLPPGTGNQLGEIAAVERVLSDQGAGERILLLCDCQGAMRAVEEHWRSGTLGWESGGDTRPGSALIEMVIRHRLRICGHKQQQDSEDAHADTHVEAMTEEEWAEVRSEGTGVEGMTEAGAALVEAILEQRGCVCILWVPAHGGGIAPNAYADAAAKSHLAETPMDIPLWTLPRTVVYAIAQEGTPHNSKQWCLLAARPLRRLIVERLTRKQLDEWQEQAPREAYSGAQTIITARDANTHILAAMSRSDKAGTDREQSATGRSQRLRSDDVGMPVSRGGGRGRKSRGAELEEDESDDPGEEDEQEDDNKKCELCGDKWADGLHALHCKRLQGAERARSEVETAIRRAAAAIPTGETRTKTDTAKEWRREARETAPDSVAQRMDGQPPEMEQGEKREFSMVGASSGWCKSKEYMEMRLQLREDGTEPPEIGLARFCALATWNAYEAAAGAGGRATEGWALREAARSIGVTRQGANGPVLDETAMAAAESEARTGIRRIEVEYGQLHAETAPDTAGTISVSNWRGEEGEWLRERSAAAMRTGRWTIATQRRFQQGQGAHGRKIVECMAVSPHGEVYSVAPATAWPWRLCYHLQVGRLEPDMPGHLQVKVRLAEGDEGQLEATVRAEIIGYTGKKLHVAGEGWVRTTIAPTENGDSGVRMLFGVHGWPCTTPRHSTIGGAFETAIQAVGRQTTALETAEREQQWRAVRTILAGVVPALDIAERRWEKERREHEAVAAQERAEEEERQQDAPPENEMSTAETAAYETLGTEPGAKMAQVRSAFRKQALRTHPDRPGGDAMAFRRVEEAMRTITERAQEKGPTNGNTPTLHQIRPRVWELIVASLTTGSESLFRAIGAHQRATRRQKELEAASEGTTITEQRERRRTGRREAHILEKEAAQETARAAMQAEESRVQQARQSRGAAEVEALTSLEGQRAIQAFVMDPEYIRKNYEVWLPNGMWGRKHGKTGGHTPFRIVEYDIRYNESATEGATMWCKLEASSATLICKLEVNETVLGGERSWEEKRCFWAPVHDEEGGEEEGPGEEIEALEAAAEKNIATRARKLMREAAAARRAAEAARERGRGEPMGGGGGATRTRTHRTTGDARMGRIAQLEFTNSWRSTTTRTATQTPQATPTQTNAEMRQAARRTIFAARAAAAAAGETAMWSIRQQTAATAMEWADAEARMLTAARTNAIGSEGRQEENGRRRTPRKSRHGRWKGNSPAAQRRRGEADDGLWRKWYTKYGQQTDRRQMETHCRYGREPQA